MAVSVLSAPYAETILLLIPECHLLFQYQILNLYLNTKCFHITTIILFSVQSAVNEPSGC
jgi:hypothetical protein